MKHVCAQNGCANGMYLICTAVQPGAICVFTKQQHITKDSTQQEIILTRSYWGRPFSSYARLPVLRGHSTFPKSQFVSLAF